MPLPKEPDKELSWRSEKTDTVNNMDEVYEFWWNRNHASKGGSTPYHVLINGFSRRPPPPNLNFFLASLNLEDEIHFKGGSL